MEENKMERKESKKEGPKFRKVKKEYIKEGKLRIREELKKLKREKEKLLLEGVNEFTMDKVCKEITNGPDGKEKRVLGGILTAIKVLNNGPVSDANKKLYLKYKDNLSSFLMSQ